MTRTALGQCLFLASIILFAGSARDPQTPQAGTPTSASILKTALIKRMNDLQAVRGDALSTNTAVAKLVDNQLNEGTVRGFTLVQDEPDSVAGTAKGPTPTDYFVESIAFCENVVFVRNAALNDVVVLGLETTVSGDWNQKGLFDLDGANSAFQNIVVTTRVRTTASVDKVAEVARMTHRRCPIHATLRKAANLSFRLYVNGVEVPL